jgi:hypothetical protein
MKYMLMKKTKASMKYMLMKKTKVCMKYMLMKKTKVCMKFLISFDGSGDLSLIVGDITDASHDLIISVGNNYVPVYDIEKLSCVMLSTDIF